MAADKLYIQMMFAFVSPWKHVQDSIELPSLECWSHGGASLPHDCLNLTLTVQMCSCSFKASLGANSHWFSSVTFFSNFRVTSRVQNRNPGNISVHRSIFLVPVSLIYKIFVCYFSMEMQLFTKQPGMVTVRLWNCW